MRRRLLSFAFLVLAVTGSTVHAQSAVDASAIVAVASPTGNGVRNLAFGTITITPGATQTIAIPAAVNPQSATAVSAEFRFDVSSAAGVDFQLSLPTSLVSTAGPEMLAISFNGAQYGAHCVVAGAAACTLTTFNPATTPAVRVCSDYKGNGECKANKTWTAGSELRFYLGGALTVPPTQLAATYTATVTLQITQVY